MTIPFPEPKFENILDVLLEFQKLNLDGRFPPFEIEMGALFYSAFGFMSLGMTKKEFIEAAGKMAEIAAKKIKFFDEKELKENKK